jgi:hypothetical protein
MSNGGICNRFPSFTGSQLAKATQNNPFATAAIAANDEETSTMGKNQCSEFDDFAALSASFSQL